MSPDFNWQTEDEDGAALTAVPDSQPLDRSYQRWLTWVIIAVFLGGGGGWAAWSQIQRQVDGVDNSAQLELIANHRLVEAAAAQGDTELLTVFLSGRDWGWTEAQVDLAAAGLFVDRTPFGLTAVAHNFGEPEVTLSPRMTAAEMIITRPYLTDDNETVYLRQTAVYRRSSNSQWLYAPPLPEFWGEREEIRLPRLTVTFPARDRAVAERLAADLERIVGDLCRAAPELNCLPGFRLTLNLTTDPASLTVLAQPTARLSAAQTISLPTPTLVGLPVDDAAYRALYRGYAAQLLSPAVSYLFDWECCLHHLYYMAALDWQLDQLGVKPWPLIGAGYVDLLGQAPQIETLRALWYASPDLDVSDDSLMSIYALVEFIFTSYGGDTPWSERQRRIPLTINFRDWLLLNHPPALNVPEIEAEWYAYMAGRATAAQNSPPVVLPDDALYLACAAPSTAIRVGGAFEPVPAQLSLWQYRFGSDEVALDAGAPVYKQDFPSADFGVVSMQPLADQAGLQLSATVFEQRSGQWYRWLWQNGEMAQLWPPINGAPVDKSLVGVDPAANWLLFANSQNEQPQPEMVPIACAAGDCASVLVPGWPVWSPDGRQMIVVGVPDPPGSPDSPQFWATGDGEIVAELGVGTGPLWIDNETAVIYQRQPEQAFSLVTAGDLVRRPLFTVADLTAVFPEPVEWDGVHRLEILADPANPQRWYIVASDGYWGSQQPHSRRLYVIAYDRDSERFTSIYYHGDSLLVYNGAGISGDGRYLSLFLQTTPLPVINEGALLQILDLQTGRISAEFETAYNTVDGRAVWSPDGRWLAVLQRRTIVLYNPAHNYQRLIGLNQPGCQLAAWSD
jgi:hypothetical protein